MFRRHTRRAFSLLELMLVLIIIGILGGIAALNLTGAAEKARIRATEASIQTIERGLKEFHFETGVYPTMEEGIQVLVERKILDKVPTDGWERQFEYYYPVEGNVPYEIVSPGKDGVLPSEDDIISWQIDQ